MIRLTRPSHPYVLVALAVFLALGATAYHVGWRNLFLTPDQRGRFLMKRGRPGEAASAFRDPVWRGVALFRAGDFKAAAQAFGGVDTAEGAYDQGNALVMLGKYDDAVRRYERALALRPGWEAAAANRAIARLRAERMRQEGGETGDIESSPDEIVYDKGKKGGADTTVEGDGKLMSDEAVRALWLKRVQTRPADFLRVKFAYQLQTASGADSGAPAQGRRP
ncbi:tetratricopeptide repeat protein [Methylorubrum rhodesianum]|uniref:tetratricopeptide repeat protein n=1 Tax=Methylorubrum TaxID=2282523 RepID=UPI0016130958|nr:MULTISPECIES: tetratricopeptide repeat protein [Methylorubrum]MBB5764420.1 Ca-activated chloride channel family protein [Methylorubrum rhodesianum]MBI1689613.1 tetratricopeptide repeat protein [Methylorubrum sp. DB1722]